MAQQEDLSIDQGTDVAIEIHLTNPDGSKKSLVNYTAAAQMRRTVNTSDSDAITFTADIKLPETDGIVLLTLTNAQTAAIQPNRYMYDVEISHDDSDGNTLVEKVLYGIIEVTPNITRV